ncbi:hypothetical protein GCM10027187_15310 [Streptosporangium sandarakinum]|uniref:Outer membrane channel protein CpnT-like N-terminal domain-containing protein n=1 Tax=Streptosporangium sandarakinum TaxID=1260955 RepID=A0A852V399_9ACTN|nr:nucleotidyl transferase AbiEii/AbiGii toxin family protein [Streptosporangium sandarakinum]NYF42506.1 hypothetical protein [Streptosporangium sandarakinum]
MGFDGFLTPDWAKPYVGWVVGMDWPEGDETGCFRLADACVTAAHRLVAGTVADQPWSAGKIGSEWDGEAHKAFTEHVTEVVGGRVAELVERLINTAIALNNIGVQIQYTKYMIEATVWLMIVQVGYLLATAIANGGASLALIPSRLAIARMAVALIARRALINMAMFAGIVAGMDGGIQLLQIAQGRRDDLDGRQLAISALSGGAMGALMGGLQGGLTHLATSALRSGLSKAEMSLAEKLLAAATHSIYGQAGQYALTGGITTAGSMLAEGNFDWDMFWKGVTSSALGADGQHLTTALHPNGGPPPSGPSGPGSPPDGPPPPGGPPGSGAGSGPGGPDPRHPVAGATRDTTLSHVADTMPIPDTASAAVRHAPAPQPGSEHHSGGRSDLAESPARYGAPAPLDGRPAGGGTDSPRRGVSPEPPARAGEPRQGEHGRTDGSGTSRTAGELAKDPARPGERTSRDPSRPAEGTVRSAERSMDGTVRSAERSAEGTVRDGARSAEGPKETGAPRRAEEAPRHADEPSAARREPAGEEAPPAGAGRPSTARPNPAADHPAAGQATQPAVPREAHDPSFNNVRDALAPGGADRTPPAQRTGSAAAADPAPGAAPGPVHDAVTPSTAQDPAGARPGRGTAEASQAVPSHTPGQDRPGRRRSSEEEAGWGPPRDTDRVPRSAREPAARETGEHRPDHPGRSDRSDSPDSSDTSGPSGRTHHADRTGERPPDLTATASFPQFWRELSERVRIEAERRGTTPLDELQQFTIQRVLARFFSENPHDWVLKGGQSMLARRADGRASTDLDFTRVTPGDPESMVRDYERALARDLGDHLTFVQESRFPLLHGAGVRLSHVAYFGGRELMRVSVDLAPPRTRPVWKEAEVIPFPEHAIGTGAPGERPNLRVISLHDTLAHKVSGMFTHGRRTIETKCHECTALGKGRFMCKSGDLPYRAQDLVDVLTIAMHTSWDGPATHAMLREEFTWRIEQGENLIIPDHFEVPNPNWHKSFAKYATTTPGLPYTTLREATPLARAFLDPLLAEEPPRGHWDPSQRRWVDDAPQDAGVPRPAAEAPSHAADAAHHTPVQQMEGTGHAPPSDALADPGMIRRWETLSGRRDDPGSFEALVADLKGRTDLSLPEKVKHLQDEIMGPAGYKPTEVTGLDSKNLRVYVHQRGELYIHSAALMTDPGTTIEIAYKPDRTFQTYAWEAREAYTAYLGPLPEGIGVEEANAVAYRRMREGRPVHDGDPTRLAEDLLDLHAEPFRDALKMRSRLIEDYGVAPERIRLAYADGSQDVHYSNTRWVRAHLFALDAIRENPVEARRAMLDAIRGPGEEGRIREARARAAADRLFAANESPGDPRPPSRRKYALLWIRDSRDQPVGGRHGPHLDTRPEMVRQTIEALRESHPDRRIVLLGDDLFARRPELREGWEREGVLDGVDAETLVGFWAPEHNGGRALSHGEQALFFHHLTVNRDIVQIGMESGALETPIVLGTPTVYLEAREHDGNKGNRWALYWQDWVHGRTEPVLDAEGRQRFDDALQPLTTFHGDEPRPAPLSTIERVLYGPDLPDPTNRRGQAVAVYLPAKVSVTADRIIRLVDSGELDRWHQRIGDGSALDRSLPSWTAEDWEQSRYYAGQLHRWLRTEATTPEEAGRKWDGIRLGLTGVIDPRFTVDQTYEGASIVHPYYMLHTDHVPPADEAGRMDRAYAAEPGERGAAVTEVLKDLLGGPDFRHQAVEDMRLFRFEPSEIRDLRAAIDQVTGDHPEAADGHDGSHGLPDGTPERTGSPAEPPHVPYGDRLDVPIVPDGPTPREVLERFDPAVAGLPELTAREAADHIARNAERRPWLAPALGGDPAVQRVIAALDLGQAHILERHGPYVDDGMLEGRVARLEDPAQTDAGKRVMGTDAYAPGDRVHRSPDTATAIRDVDAFATAFARAVEDPRVLAALRTEFDPENRPGRVSVPIADLLGPDGHLHCSGYRIESIGGSPEAAVENRAAWVEARRSGRVPDVAEPRARPMGTFEGGTVEFFFQVNAERNGYEIATMFVDPAPGAIGRG